MSIQRRRFSKEPMESLSFDSMADIYDESRCFDEDCFDSALGFLSGKFPSSVFRKVFEPGIGTGRIAIALAERGYQITGIDISEKMLTVLSDKSEKQLLNISFQKADVTNIPFIDSGFDMVIVVHLFYFIRDWKKAVNEILRVVKNGYPIVLMHTGTGMEIPFLNNRYKELCEKQGCPIDRIGAKNTKEVTDYFQLLGYHVELIRDRWKWISRIRLDKAISYLYSRSYSFTVFVPSEIHVEILSLIESEFMNKFGSLDIEIKVPNQIYFAIVSP